MANTSNSDKWYFTKEQLENTPSKKCGFDDYKELQYRQQAANFIQDMGQRLKVSQLCINTAIVYMHRFYVFHSFTNFPWHQMAAAALFLAAKVEEQPRKLEYVIRVANICKNPRDTSFDINSERYIAQSQDLVFNENVLLQTLGFDVAIDHPHTYVVRCCHLVRASKDLAQTSYFMASNSLHLTTMCIQYKPTVVACFCILLACKWSNWEIPLSNEKKEWYTYVDPTVTAELLQQLTSEFLVIFENCPSRLKEKIMAKQESSGSPFEQDRKQDSSSQRALEFKGDDPHKHRSRPHEASASGHRSQEQREREYKERKEKERVAHMSGITLPHQSHHHRPERPPVDPKMKLHSRPQSSSQPYPLNNRIEPRDILREAAKDSPFGIPTVRDPNREHTKDPYGARSDKEVPKRDPLLKPNVQTDPNSLTNYSDVRQQRIDPSRSRIDPSKPASKQDMMRRYEEQKPHIKSETDNIKKHLSSSFDKNSAYLKSSSSTSQKIKSPLSLDNKSVPKTSSSQANVPPKTQFNGNTNGSCNKPAPQETEVKVKTEPFPIKEEIPTPAFIKRPSLFSPEKTPPQVKLELKSDPQAEIASFASLTALSPINSPPSVPSMRNRNYSSSSEPELRPTMKKIDQVEGFENLMRDSTIGMANIANVADIIPVKKEHKSPQKNETKTERISPTKDNSQHTIVNGLETNPTLISNLLKEAASTSHLSGVATSSIKTVSVEQSSQSNMLPPPEHKEKEHHHHKSKKKKEKHKHRDKDKHREEKDKKKKHKDKDRERHKHKEKKEVIEPKLLVSEPIKIKIQRDKIQPLNEGLKIKIPKDKIKTEGIVDPLPQPSSGGLKIKIPKEMITNCNANSGHSINSVDTSFSSSSSSRKRERDRTSPTDMPPLKISKSSHRDSKQNGKHSYNKVSSNPPPSSENLAINAQVDSSISENAALSEKKPSEEIVLPNSVPLEENNNESLVKEVTETTLPCKGPMTPKYVSSTIEMVSPTPLSPISPISPLHESDCQMNLSLIPLSPISASNTPPFEQKNLDNSDIGYSSTTSFNHESFFGSTQVLDRSTALSSGQKVEESRSNTPPGYPTNTFLSYDEKHTNSLSHPRTTPPPTYINHSPPPYHQKNANFQWQQRSSTPPGYRTVQAQPTNSNMEGRKPPPYNANPYKLVNHHTPYQRNNIPQFPKQHRNSGNYENYEYSSYNAPPYQPSAPKGYNSLPRYPSQGSTNHQLPPSHTLSTYHVPPIPQSQDSQIHYSPALSQMPYNAYQVAPPAMPNVNVPPPSYGMYTGFFGGYMYPEIYQQPVNGFGGINQPPLPAEAPPSEAPPPPPPE